MFDLGWVELLFVATLALVIVGPRDMPKLLKVVARAVAKARKIYTDIFSGIKRLEQEVDLASGDRAEKNVWQGFMPEAVRNLPADFIPGTLTPERHQQRRAEFERSTHSLVDGAQPQTASRDDPPEHHAGDTGKRSVLGEKPNARDK